MFGEVLFEMNLDLGKSTNSLNLLKTYEVVLEWAIREGRLQELLDVCAEKRNAFNWKVWSDLVGSQGSGTGDCGVYRKSSSCHLRKTVNPNLLLMERRPSFCLCFDARGTDLIPK